MIENVAYYLVFVFKNIFKKKKKGIMKQRLVKSWFFTERESIMLFSLLVYMFKFFHHFFNLEKPAVSTIAYPVEINYN